MLQSFPSKARTEIVPLGRRGSTRWLSAARFETGPRYDLTDSKRSVIEPVRRTGGPTSALHNDNRAIEIAVVSPLRTAGPTEGATRRDAVISYDARTSGVSHVLGRLWEDSGAVFGF
jgi:hypothetical protein